MLEREIKLIKKIVKFKLDNSEDQVTRKAVEFISAFIEELKKEKKFEDDAHLLFEALFELAKERILLDEEMEDIVKRLNPEESSKESNPT